MQDEIPVVVVSTPLELPNYLPGIVEYLTSHFPTIFHNAQSTIGYIMGFSIPICLLLIIGVALSLHGLYTIRKREEPIYNEKIEIAYDEVTKADPAMTHKWEKISTLVESPNESDWRQAIIESDIILGELLAQMGYKGVTIGEQLGRVAKGDFKTLSQANEAHFVRNRIAHDGINYPLTQYDARHVISLYRDVFEEFDYI